MKTKGRGALETLEPEAVAGARERYIVERLISAYGLWQGTLLAKQAGLQVTVSSQAARLGYTLAGHWIEAPCSYQYETSQVQKVSQKRLAGPTGSQKHLVAVLTHALTSDGLEAARAHLTTHRPIPLSRYRAMAELSALTIGHNLTSSELQILSELLWDYFSFPQQS